MISSKQNSRKISIIEAPSNLGLKDTGVDKLSEALISMGLADRLSARLAWKIIPPAYNAQRDPTTGILNAHSIAKYSVLLADSLSEVLDGEEFPIVLGGDCSIILGIMLALRRKGRFGLFYADGHADFYQPEANINGEAASSCLAFATGRGPGLLTSFEGYNRLIHDEDIAVFGFRDIEEQLTYGSQPLPASIYSLDLDTVRRVGTREAALDAIRYLYNRKTKGTWLHLDADILSDTVMPAVDYLQPDGFSWDELVTMLQVVLASGQIIGLDITIYNPRLDPECSIAADFVSSIVSGLKFWKLHGKSLQDFI